MSDTRSKEKVSEIMSMVHSKDTKPEILVRRLIYGLGFRYRLHRKDLTGRPDIVMIGRRKIVDVRGCFWHGHGERKYGRLPRSREVFRKTEIHRNRESDSNNLRMPNEAGWRVLVVWYAS